MGERTRDYDFTQEPEDGWAHEDNGLAMGDGVFFSFNVLYVGTVTVEQSLRSLNLDQQTTVTRELVALVSDAHGSRPPTKRKVDKKLQPWLQGGVQVAGIPVALNISAEGLVISPANSSDPNAVLEVSKMNQISLAAGGEGHDYDLISYVSKDSSGRRECFVFDCGVESDSVLATIGQAFILAQELAARKRKKPQEKAANVDKANFAFYDPPTEQLGDYLQTVAKADYDEAGGAYMAVQPEYDTACGSYLDVTPDSIYETATQDAGSTHDTYMAVAKTDVAAAQPVYDSAAKGDMENPVYEEGNYIRAEPTYDTAGSYLAVTPLPEVVYHNPDKSQLVSTLNKHATIKKSVRLKKKASKKDVADKIAEMAVKEEPDDGKWVYMDMDNLKKTTVDELK